MTSAFDDFDEWSGDSAIPILDKIEDIKISTDSNNIKEAAWNKKFTTPSARRLINELFALNNINWGAPDDNPYRILFTLKDEKTGAIIIELKFNESLYPYYPPSLTILQPFLGTLSIKLSMLRMLQLKYWNPTRTIHYILETITTIIKKNVTKVTLTKQSPRILEFQAALLQFNSFSDSELIVEDLDPVVYKAVNVVIDKVDSSTEKTIKSSSHLHGVGYGTDNSSKWNVQQWEAAKVEKNSQRELAISKLLKLTNDAYAEEAEAASAIVEFCSTTKILCEILRETSILEMVASVNCWCNIVNILITMASTKLNTELTTSMYKLLAPLCATISIVSEPKLSKSLKVLMKIISKDLGKSKIAKIANGDDDDPYVRGMREYQFDEYPIVANKDSFYLSQNKVAITNYDDPKRLMVEKAMLVGGLPLNRTAAILCRHDDSNIGYYKFLVFAAEGTPYSAGAFIFDVSIPPNYPYPTRGESPIRIILCTTGRNTVRFNPNLYRDGKVCLSLLGTFPGAPSENWRPTMSTLLQLIVSIYSSVMNPMPYYNEPGHFEGSDSGVASKTYNETIRLETMRWAILDQLKNPPPAFKDAIMFHFKERKNEIFAQCEQWVAEASNKLKNDYTNTFAQIQAVYDAYGM
jgi:ubiquitin-protein ligase